MDHCRLNSPSTSTISIEVFGHKLQISQDPNSKHHGTTVWDASMVFVKYLEKNCRKGKFSPSKMKGKRVIELGAGCGLAGLGMCMLGCDVISTDQLEVIPLLNRNIERNISYISQANPNFSGSFGSIKVAELNWGNKNQIEYVGPPFDYIIGTDVVYSEHLLEPLIQTILALSGPRTIILIGYEIRSTIVHAQMIQMLKNYFNLKTIPKSKMDNKYQHPSIDLYSMELKAQSKFENEIKLGESNDVISDEERENLERENLETGTEEEINEPVRKNGTLDEWEIRRVGAMAARLLKDVKLT